MFHRLMPVVHWLAETIRKTCKHIDDLERRFLKFNKVVSKTDSFELQIEDLELVIAKLEYQQKNHTHIQDPEIRCPHQARHPVCLCLDSLIPPHVDSQASPSSEPAECVARVSSCFCNYQAATLCSQAHGIEKVGAQLPMFHWLGVATTDEGTESMFQYQTECEKNAECDGGYVKLGSKMADVAAFDDQEQQESALKLEYSEKRAQEDTQMRQYEIQSGYQMQMLPKSSNTERVDIDGKKFCEGSIDDDWEGEWPEEYLDPNEDELAVWAR